MTEPIAPGNAPTQQPQQPDGQQAERTGAVRNIQEQLQKLRQAVQPTTQAGQPAPAEQTPEQRQQAILAEIQRPGGLLDALRRARELHNGSNSSRNPLVVTAWQNIERSMFRRLLANNEQANVQQLLEGIIDSASQTETATRELAVLAAEVNGSHFADEEAAAVQSYLTQFEIGPRVQDSRLRSAIGRFFQGVDRNGRVERNAIGPRIVEMFNKVGINIEDITEFVMSMFYMMLERLPVPVRMVEDKRWEETLAAATLEQQLLLREPRFADAAQRAWRQAYKTWVKGGHQNSMPDLTTIWSQLVPQAPQQQQQPTQSPDTQQQRLFNINGLSVNQPYTNIPERHSSAQTITLIRPSGQNGPSGEVKLSRSRIERNGKKYEMKVGSDVVSIAKLVTTDAQNSGSLQVHLRKAGVEFGHLTLDTIAQSLGTAERATIAVSGTNVEFQLETSPRTTL